MSRTILCLTALILASSANAADLRNTTRDSAGYEAKLRSVGIPLSAGLTWPVTGPAPQAKASRTA